MTVLVVENNLFKQMQSYKTLKCNQRERQQMKQTFIDRIKEKVSLRWNRANKLLQVIDEIIYKATDRGYSFNGRETLAAKCNASLSTVDKAIKIIKESGEAIVAYRHNPSSNGYKTPIIILKGHEHFKHWKDLLHLEDNVEQKVGISEDTETPTLESMKKISTYNHQSKQERYINISNPTYAKIVRYVTNRVKDTIKQGTRIKYLSSYIDRIVHSLEKQAIYAENERQIKARKQREKESSLLAEELGLRKQREIPFYNWLES
jgi:hypothetical protein